MTTVTFPDVLLQSSDFGDFEIVVSDERFVEEVAVGMEYHGPDFDPDYTEWNKVEGTTDIYSTVYAAIQDGKTTRTTLKAQATWSELEASFEFREVDDDLSAYTNSLLSFTPPINDEPEGDEDNSEDEFWHRQNTEQWDRETLDDA